MKTLLLLFVFFSARLLAADKPPGVDTLAQPVWVNPASGLGAQAIEESQQFKELKARAEKAEMAAEYWKAIAERNELAIRVVQFEAQLADIKRRLAEAEASKK